MAKGPLGPRVSPDNGLGSPIPSRPPFRRWLLLPLPRGCPATSSPIHSRGASSFIPAPTPGLIHALAQAAAFPSFVHSFIPSLLQALKGTRSQTCPQGVPRSGRTCSLRRSPREPSCSGKGMRQLQGLADQGPAAKVSSGQQVWQGRKEQSRPVAERRAGHAVFVPGGGEEPRKGAPFITHGAGRFASSPESLEFPSLPGGPLSPAGSGPGFQGTEVTCSWGPPCSLGKPRGSALRSLRETPVLPAVWSQSERPCSGLLSSEASGLEIQAQRLPKRPANC